MIGRLLRLAQRLPSPVRRVLRSIPGTRRVWEAVMGRPRAASPPPGGKRPVVYLPTWLTWDEMRQRPQYLLAAFAAAGHPTYFVDSRSAERVTPEGVTIVSSLRALPRDHPILYVHYAPLRTLFERFVNPVVVYDVLDDLSIFDADDAALPEERRVRPHHEIVVSDAEITIVSSPVLFDRHVAERSDLLLVANGVDTARFGASRPRPADLPADRPIIGFHGAVAEWFDFDLFEAVARSSPQWRFVVVGPIQPRVRARAKRVEALDNVAFVGERPSDDVPGYVQAFDVGTVWFVVNEMTRGVDPLKMYECLAAGVPVVATPLPACRDVVGVSVAAGAAEFTQAIETALGRNEAERQRLVEAAGEASWDTRLAPVLDRLEAIGSSRVPL